MLWLVVAALVPPAAALGAVDVAVPAAARAQGEPSVAGVLLAAMAVGTVAGSLLSGRRAWRSAPERRLVAFQVVMGLGLAAAALAWERPALLAAALLIPGAAVGALFATLYVLVDHLTPVGSGTRIFAWLVTANNAGIAAGSGARRGAQPGLGSLRRTVAGGRLRTARSAAGNCRGSFVRTRTTARTNRSRPQSTFRQTGHSRPSGERRITGGAMSHWKN